MNKFQEAEALGRSYFKRFSEHRKITDLKFDENDYSRTDCSFILNGKQVIGEIKVRDISCLNYSDLILEVDKYNSIKDKIKGTDTAGTYINFIGSNVLYIFNINKINEESCKRTYKSCKRTTAIDSGYTLKEVFIVHKKVGVRYEFNGDKWKRCI